MSTTVAGVDHEEGPFGPPDGARADLDEIRSSFVRLSDIPMDDLDHGPNASSPRLIVGKKGVGKTVYLRSLRAAASDEASIYADAVRHDVPLTEDVIKINEYSPGLAVENWKWIWRRAIMRSLASHLLRRPELRGHLSLEQAQSLEDEFKPVLGKLRNPRSVYTEARQIASKSQGKDGLRREMHHEDWDDIEELLGVIMDQTPPICFYLDSVDEQFETAPKHWLQCQKGLCVEVLELLRDVRFGSRLHVVVAIRDLVRSSLIRGENSTRYLRSRHIRVLDWDHKTIRRLLLEKIRRLPDRYRMNPDVDGVQGWLGVSEVYNERRGVWEQLEDYLLRHTRLIPRDVVQLGNELSNAVQEAKAGGARSLDPDTIRLSVGKVAKEFADEQIAVCANHLASDIMPMNAGREMITDYYMSETYSESVQEELCRFIAEVRYDRFPMRRLKEAFETKAGPVLSSHPNVLNVLWQNGLLGYDPPDDTLHHSHFYGADDVADFQLPLDFDSYVFHPIVAHRVWIEPAGQHPVTGFRTRAAQEQ
jgi:hypothetical protein